MISAGGILQKNVKMKRHHIISRGLKEELTLPTPSFCFVGATPLRDIWETQPCDSNVRTSFFGFRRFELMNLYII